MLIYSDTRYIPTDLNVMVIEDAGGCYFYIHRMLYDQAVVLADKFENYEELASIVAGPSGYTERFDVELFHDKTPAPINILAPFLLMCPQSFDNLTDMTGALHVMSVACNFRKLITVPYEVRNNSMQFSMSIKEEYKLSWDRFFQSCIPYKEEMFMSAVSVPMLGSMTSSTPTQTTPASLPEQSTPATASVETPAQEAPPPTPEPEAAPAEPIQMVTSLWINEDEDTKWKNGRRLDESIDPSIIIPDDAIEINGSKMWMDADNVTHYLYANGQYAEVPDSDIIDEHNGVSSIPTASETVPEEPEPEAEPEPEQEADKVEIDTTIKNTDPGLEGLSALEAL